MPNTSDQLFIIKLNALVQCDPTNCQKEACPLYYEEQHMCDADRFLNTFVAKVKLKFTENSVKTYQIVD